MNVFIAVIYENFNDVQASEDENDILSLKKKDIKARLERLDLTFEQYILKDDAGFLVGQGN